MPGVPIAKKPRGEAVDINAVVLEIPGEAEEGQVIA